MKQCKLNFSGTIKVFEAIECLPQDSILNTINDITNILYPCLHTQNIFKNIEEVNIIPLKTSNYGSSIIYYDTKYYYKSIIKTNNFTKYSFNKLFRMTLNEMLAAYIYKNLFGINTLEYEFIYFQNGDRINGTYGLKSEVNQVIKNYPKPDDFKKHNKFTLYSSKMIEQYFVDCIMSNWDAYNNNNSILDNVNDSNSNSQILMVDVGGALAYRGKGDRKLFFNSNIPDEHIIFKNQKNVKEIFSKNTKNTENIAAMKKYVTDAINKFENFKNDLYKKTIPSNNVINVIDKLPNSYSYKPFKKNIQKFY